MLIQVFTNVKRTASILMWKEQFNCKLEQLFIKPYALRITNGLRTPASRNLHNELIFYSN